LKEVSYNEPVFLTEDGRNEYAIVTLQEWDELKATINLLSKLEEGEVSAKKSEWLSADEVEGSICEKKNR